MSISKWFQVNIPLKLSTFCQWTFHFTEVKFSIAPGGLFQTEEDTLVQSAICQIEEQLQTMESETSTKNPFRNNINSFFLTHIH